MPRKTKRSRARKKSPTLTRAIRAGKALAGEAIVRREKQRRKRMKTLRSPRVALRAARASVAPAIPARTVAALRQPQSAGIVIAEGDSWFDYPFYDTLSLLEDEHGFDVESVAHWGDRVEDMAYTGGQFATFTRKLEKMLRDGKVPRAILLSGGGNDIAGTELGVMFNHALSGLPAANEDVVRGVIDVRIRAAYVTMISGLTEICKHYLNRPLRIITHGYARPVPDGRGFWGGAWILPGPWLKPGFDQKGFKRPQSTQLVGALLDRFNAMVAGVSAMPAFGHVRYLDLRPLLPNNDDTFKTWWGNELHPTERGFKRVAEAFARAIVAP